MQTQTAPRRRGRRPLRREASPPRTALFVLFCRLALLLSQAAARLLTITTLSVSGRCRVAAEERAPNDHRPRVCLSLCPFSPAPLRSNCCSPWLSTSVAATRCDWPLLNRPMFFVSRMADDRSNGRSLFSAKFLDSTAAPQPLTYRPDQRIRVRQSNRRFARGSRRRLENRVLASPRRVLAAHSRCAAPPVRRRTPRDDDGREEDDPSPPFLLTSASAALYLLFHPTSSSL